MPDKPSSESKQETNTKASEDKAVGQKPAQSDPLYVVGIGASAGGLDALEKFFQHMPPDSNIAFVVVTHSDPSKISILPELIQKQTRMRVFAIEDGMKLAAGSVYVVPSNNDVGIISDTLQLIEPIEKYGFRLPIDYFLKTLAVDQKEKAVCIILSGMGTDGTLGLKVIKEQLGMVMVHDPESSKFDGMPQSAIGTGLADYVLPPEKMPDQLAAYIRQAGNTAIAITEALPARLADSKAQSADALQKIFIALRAHTGHDFSQYKKSTIYRRIERRMNIQQIDSISDYFKYLQKNSKEIRTLFKELLIGVTNFFRDTEAFEALSRDVLPRLLDSKPDDYRVRMWVSACSTGEEAYSLAIVLKEYMEQNQRNFSDVQIFATDLDEDAIEIARNGTFPANIAGDVSKERLSRYFVKQDDVFQIRKEIREMLIFAPQDIIKDPPFTKLDMISCRNFLIYLENELQQKIIPLFHYALSPGGILFFGSSETIGGFVDMFSVVDKKWKIYERKENSHTKHGLVEFPLQSAEKMDMSVSFPKTANITNAQLVDRILLRDMTPACVLVSKTGETLYIHGRTGKYLEPAQGEFRSNIIDMARKGLKFEMSAALRNAMGTQKEVVYEGLNVDGNGSSQRINLIVRPLREPDISPGYFLVIFKVLNMPAERKASVCEKGPDGITPEVIHTVEKELQYTKENLQTTIEELETSNEELKSTNEELQSTNEELQSANEELETSKEEQQSLNEELQTVNCELQKKIEELSKSNNDMKNLLDSLEIPTVFLDNNLCIKRYTAHISEIMNLIRSDIGRSINDFVIKIRDASELMDYAWKVLRDLAFREKEVQTTEGHWYLMRIRPYRTTENVIDGLVITFLDIHDQKKTEEKIKKLNIENQDARAYAESIIETLRESILVLDEKFTVISANSSFYRYFKISSVETLGKKLYDLGDGQWDIPELRRLLEQIIPKDDAFENFEIEHDFPVIGFRKIVLNARKIVSEGSMQARILLVIDNVYE